MKKRLFRLLTITIVLSSLFLAFRVPVRADDDTLEATEIHVEVTVSEDNIFTITENITINFLTPHHGIIRNIPLSNWITRQDGSTSYNSATVTNVECNEPYTTGYSGGDYSIRIGDADKTVTGIKKYVLKYTYDIGNDPLKGADELYLNIIGTGWNYDIHHLRVTIHLPKEFDPGKLGVSHGKEGSIDYSGVKQKIEGNNIYLEYEETLKPGEAFTVRCEFEEGYFKRRYSWHDIINRIVCTVATLGLLILNRRNYVNHGKPEKPVETVEFYPPENLTPPAMYYAANKNVSRQSVNGLLLMLADKGCLIIEDLGSDDYQFILLEEDLEGLSEEERIYLRGLWLRATEQDDGTMLVTKDDLEGKFYSSVSDVQSHVRRHAARIHEKGQGKYAFFSALCGAALIIVVPITMLLSDTFNQNPWYNWAIGGAAVAVGVYLIFLSFLYHRRTQENNRLYGRILGFKNFIEVAEKDRLEMLAAENPHYFYDILPYAYALGISDVWIKKFQGILIEPVDWYRGDDFDYFIDHSMNTYESVASSVPASDSSSSDSWTSDSGWSSSSDSGGGSSGGGSF